MRFQHRRDKDVGAEEELGINAGKLWLVGELPGQGAHDSRASSMGLVEESVHVRQKGVADIHRSARSRGYTLPTVRLLRVGRKNIVVSVEREEC